MRVNLRIAFFLAVAIVAAPLFADHFTADCPLTLVGSTPASPASFNLSPHGVFRMGSQIFVVRGGVLSTYTVTDLGDLQLARPDDTLTSLAGRESNGGIAFSGGTLFLSSEAGLEVHDLKNVRAGGSPPLLVSRTPGLHYRRLAVNGNLLAALYPATDYPCTVNGSINCYNQIDLYNISNLSAPVRVATITSLNNFFVGFNDVAFNQGYLIATGIGGTFAFNVSNPAIPTTVATDTFTPGTFLVSNGTLLAVGNDRQILTYNINPLSTSRPFFDPITLHTLPNLTTLRANPIVFHRQAFVDDQNGRLITLIDELNPQTLQPARTLAFDVFDYSTPMYEGSDPRLYEVVSYTTTDEVKHNPVAVGPMVFVVGETSGVQEYGACGQPAGKIEWDGVAALLCGGAEIHGWVTGDQKITNVELFIDGTSLGSVVPSGFTRNDIPSRTPVQAWQLKVNLDNTARGEHLLRAVGTDANGNRRQFSSVRVFFGGPGQNCTVRRRSSGSK